MKVSRILSALVLLVSYCSWASADSAVVAGPDGKYYQRIDAGAITWSAARTAATALSYQGAPGQLVTLLTLAEANAANVARAEIECWMGGTGNLAANPDEWSWITGELFWLGVADGAAQNSLYTQWSDGEPNGSGTWLEWDSGDFGWDDTSNEVNDCYLVQFNVQTTSSRPSTPIPTMSLYGLVLTMLGLLFVAGRHLRASAKRK